MGKSTATAPAASRQSRIRPFRSTRTLPAAGRRRSWAGSTTSADGASKKGASIVPSTTSGQQLPRRRRVRPAGPGPPRRRDAGAKPSTDGKDIFDLREEFLASKTAAMELGKLSPRTFYHYKASRGPTLRFLRP